MKKTYKDGLIDALGKVEDVYAEYSPLDNFNEEVQKVVHEVYIRLNKLIYKEQEKAK